jgi:glycosyltransferase involved in cell wall biosynthesis
MRIGYFVSKFPYYQGGERYSERYPYSGLEVAAYNLALRMAKRGHEINVFTTAVDSKDSIEKYENITIYRYGTNFRIFNRNISFNMLFKSLKNEVDIVHVHLDESILAALLYAKRKKVPLVVTYHGDMIDTYGKFISKTLVYFYNKLVNKLLSYADVTISPSECYIGESKFLGKYRDKVVVIPYGMNVEEFAISYTKEESREKLGLSRNKNIILFVGVLGSHKGPDILIKAMQKIIKSVSDVKLVFVGRGPLREELEIMSKKIGINEHVKFTGFIGSTFKKMLYYKSADIFVLPSTMRHESCGIVNLEAMACGVPIVASKIGGVPDVVKDGENGLLVPPKDSEALADAIIYLLENEDVRDKMGKNGRKRVKGYSWEKIVEMTEKVYEGLI